MNLTESDLLKMELDIALARQKDRNERIIRLTFAFGMIVVVIATAIIAALAS